MYCKDCPDNGNCETQRRDEENRKNGVGAVFIGDRLVGCDKHDEKPRGIKTMRTQHASEI